MKNTYSNSNIKKEIIGEIIGFNKEEKSEAVNLICNLTGDNSRDVVSFGTEAGLFQEIGISTVVCGPGSIEQAHTIDEYVSFDELKRCLKMLIDLKDKINGEDECKNCEKKIQNLSNEQISEFEKKLQEKEKEVMTV